MCQEPGRWPLKHRCGAVTGTVMRLSGASKDAETEEKRGPSLYGIRTVSSWRRLKKGRGDGQFLSESPGQEISGEGFPVYSVGRHRDSLWAL